jgi:hypothetical protein
VDYGAPVWCDGTIDIAPEILYRDSIPIKMHIQLTVPIDIRGAGKGVWEGISPGEHEKFQKILLAAQ